MLKFEKKVRRQKVNAKSAKKFDGVYKGLWVLFKGIEMLTGRISE